MEEKQYKFKHAFWPLYILTSVIIAASFVAVGLFKKGNMDWNDWKIILEILMVVLPASAVIGLVLIHFCFYAVLSPLGLEAQKYEKGMYVTAHSMMTNWRFARWDQIRSVKLVSIPFMKSLKVVTDNGDISLSLNLADKKGFKKRLIQFAPEGNPLRTWFEENTE